MISSDGKILVVATISTVKVFSVRRRKGDEKGTLRIQKLDIPSALADDGARVVTMSPDSRWICVIRPNSATYLAKIKPASSSQEKPQVLTQLVKLNRAMRHSRYEKASHGTLGEYEKTIRCAVFSENSRIIAVGDLSGCIDAWSLEKAEDSRASAKANGTADSDDESSDDEVEQPVVEGERWHRTAADSPFPRLKSGVLLLSFRPLNPAGKKLLTNATQGSKVESRLMALTSEHQLVEIDALDGKLSDWSRRNPKAYLPAEFRGVKDRAMGWVWDLNEARERLWLYGTSWLWMFDLNQDFPSSEELSASADIHEDGEDSMQVAKSSSQKRKRGLLEDGENERKKTNSGAGDKMSLAQSDVFLGSKVRKIEGPDESKAEWISLDKQRPRRADEDDEAYDHDEAYTANHDVSLARLRRGNPDENEISTPTKQLVQAADNAQPACRWWHTYKYRDILGIVPISTDEESQESGDHSNLEVAVVERPMWDVELPGRYVRDYE
jgi:U3 small nucleolar RNA-associated protein 4